jgi:CMP-N-acetylneuraminic acid synthetase
VNKIAALVPMRHHSERVQGKNYRSLAGKPLYAHIIETLMQVPQVSQIVVDTDSPLIQDGISTMFPSVDIIERPEHLRSGLIPMNDVLVHDVSQTKAQFFLQTHSTNPLLRGETIQRAITEFLKGYPEKDSLFSVTRISTRLWDADGNPINHDPGELLRTQDLPPVYEENSSIYLFERETFLRRSNRLGDRPTIFEIDAIEAFDIDTELNFQIAEYLKLNQDS